MTRFNRFFLTFTLGFALTPLALAGDLNVSGTWMTAGGAHVEIADCGDGTPCGTLIWYQSENGMSEKDTFNPDPALRGNPLLGTQIVWGFKAKDEKWKSGKIYDAENGKIYKSKMALNEDGTLKVKGCVGPICQSQTWTRINKDQSAETVSAIK